MTDVIVTDVDALVDDEFDTVDTVSFQATEDTDPVD